MARPVKNNCDYFPHFTTMRNHKKVKALRAKFGQVLGYAFWNMILEYLTEQDGIELENSDLEIEMFAGELGVSATEIRDMVDYCIKIELLFLTDDNFIYSESLNELLQPVFEKRKRAKELSKTRKRHNNGSYCNNDTTTRGVSVTEMPQIKVNKSKVNKSKEEIIKETCFSFNEFWDIYPKKVDKKEAEKKYAKLSEEKRQKIKDTIKAFIVYKPFPTYNLPNPSTYINKERWNDVITPEQNKDPFYKEPIVDRTHGFSVQF